MESPFSIRGRFLNGGDLDTGVVVANLSEQDALARRQGYRGIRVVADLDWLLGVPAGFAAAVVCAYRPESFATVDLSEMLCVHPQRRHRREKKVKSFRIWNVGGDRWRLAGDIDVNSIDVFTARLAFAGLDAGLLGLDLKDVGLIDLAGLRSIARYSAEQQVAVEVEGLGETMRKCWGLLDFDAVAPDVELKA